MKKIFLPLALFITIGFNANAQEKSNSEIKGDKYTFRYLYSDAIRSYTHTKNLTPDGQRKLAESYHNLNQNKEAEIAYSKLLLEPAGVIAEDYFNYAMILKNNSKYDEANAAMDKFVDLKPDDLRGKNYIASKSSLGTLLKDNGCYKILHLDVNTEDQDFGTCYYNDQILFSSTRAFPKMIQRKYNWNGKPFLNMYVSDVENGQLKKPTVFDKSLDGKMHDGPASFSNKGTYMAYTCNNYNDKTPDKIVELQIFFSSFKDKEWSKPEAFTLNNSEYSVGHPCLTSDGKTMYFTSDMPGGFGGTDIYRITKDSQGAWQKAENLGKSVNTEGDELFPFFEETSGTLYFSSNGLMGLGGLDVFISTVAGAGFNPAYNAGSPLNTSDDDFAMITDNKMAKGYFSSNRSGGNGDDDIYSVELLKAPEVNKQITGFSKGKNGNILANAFITLLDDKGNIVDTTTTKADGYFSFKAESGKAFKLTGKKHDYFGKDTLTDTYGKNSIVKADVIFLTKDENSDTEIKVGNDLGKGIQFKPIYFDLDKYNIRPDAATELDKIVSIMNKYPNMIVELGSHTDCRESKEYNQILSDKRAAASVDYIKKRITKPGRITGKGYGKSKLVNNCSCDGEVVSTCSEEEHQKNRRTEFIIIRK